MIAAAARERDPDERMRVLERAEKLLVQDEAPIFPIFFYVGIQFYDPERFGGIRGNILDEHPIRAIYRKDDKN